MEKYIVERTVDLISKCQADIEAKCSPEEDQYQALLQVDHNTRHRWLKKIGKRITSKPVKLPILEAPENVIVAKSCSFADHFPGLSV